MVEKFKVEAEIEFIEMGENEYQAESFARRAIEQMFEGSNREPEINLSLSKQNVEGEDIE